MLLTAQKNNRFATIFAAAVILTASFDIFLAFDVAGFTVRGFGMRSKNGKSPCRTDGSRCLCVWQLCLPQHFTRNGM